MQADVQAPHRTHLQDPARRTTPDDIAHIRRLPSCEAAPGTCWSSLLRLAAFLDSTREDSGSPSKCLIHSLYTLPRTS